MKATSGGAIVATAGCLGFGGDGDDGGGTIVLGQPGSITGDFLQPGSPGRRTWRST
ncbi:MAG: hypothetical protein ACOCQU_05065 [Halolamina sp.]